MKRNAFFQLIHKKDGVYLKSYPAIDGGLEITIDDVLFYLEKKRIQNVLIDDIKKFVEKAVEETNAEQRILRESILPENEYPVITMDSERKMAKVRLYPPSSQGKKITVAELKDYIQQQGVHYGIIE